MAIYTTTAVSSTKVLYTTSNLITERPRSWCVWFKVWDDPVALNDTITFPGCAIGGTPHNGMGLKRFGASTKWRLRLTDSNSEDPGDTDIQLETWYFAAATRAGGSAPWQMSLYLDGAGTSECDLSSNTDPNPLSSEYGITSSGVATRVAFERFRQWTTILTPAEFAAEKASATLVKSANAWRSVSLVDETASGLADAVHSYNLLTYGSGWGHVSGPSFGGAGTTLSVNPKHTGASVRVG